MTTNSLAVPSLRDLTVRGVLEEASCLYPDSMALEDMHHQYTYKELRAVIVGVSDWLRSIGVQRGDIVGLRCETNYLVVIMLLALPYLGATVALLNDHLLMDELGVLATRTDMKYLVTTSGDYSSLENSSGVCVVNFTDDVIGSCAHREVAAGQPPVYSSDIGWILYTSGTTSAPKAAMATQYSLLNGSVLLAHAMGASNKDKYCVAAPMCHGFCLSANILAAISVGACLCIPNSRRNFDILSTISACRCTVLSTVPTVFNALITRDDFRNWDLSSLRVGYVGGSYCPPDLFVRINNSLGITLLGIWGQSEASAGITSGCITESLKIRSTSVGRVTAHLKYKIVNVQTGADLPIGEAGEVCIQGYLVMSGYYKQPEETAKAIDGDGWLHTGDCGYVDNAGYIHLTGRIKDVIIRGGENISAAEIENIITQHLGIVECKVIGVPDAHYGEEVCLCVASRDSSYSERQIRDCISKHLAHFKVPKYILFFDELPKTVTGKVQLGSLVQEARQRLASYSMP